MSHQPPMPRRREAPPTPQAPRPDSFWVAMAGRGGGAADHGGQAGQAGQLGPLPPRFSTPFWGVLLSAGGGLDPSTTAQELQQLFSSVAPCSVHLRRGARHIGVDSGSGGRTDASASAFAYITFHAHEQVAAAVQQFNGHEMHGSILHVTPRRPPQLPRPRVRGKKQGRAQAGRGTRVLLQVRLHFGMHLPAVGAWLGPLHAVLHCWRSWVCGLPCKSTAALVGCADKPERGSRKRSSHSELAS